LSRLGYLAAFPVAVGLTIRTRQEGVRVVSLLCLLSVALLAVFYFRGEAGMDVIAAVEGGESIGVEQQIGNIYLNFVRTQVCIPIAALAVSCLALGTCLGFRFRTLPYCLALISCVFMIVQLASIGSALAMVCGFGVIFFIYFRGRMSPSRIMLGVVAFLVVGLALYWGVFHTGSILAARIDVKNDEISATGIDRMPFWIAGITKISETPLGTGWSSVSGHSDWLLFGVAYGLPTGLLYLIAAVSIFLSLLRSRRTAADIQSLTLCLVGLAALSVYTVNSCLDMLSANVGYYQIVWALILTPSAVLAVTGVALGEPRSVANVELQYGNRNEIG
jgi:hypothetical protein